MRDSAEDRRAPGAADAATDLDMLAEIIAASGVTAASLAAAAAADAHAVGEPRAFEALDDAEWQHIAPLLPNEAPQAATMGNRAFLNAVLKAMQRGGRWTEYPKTGVSSDAVRRRFGRWAHHGVWQRLAATVLDLDLSAERKDAFGTIARRAQTLAQRR
jgi:transposase